MKKDGSLLITDDTGGLIGYPQPSGFGGWLLRLMGFAGEKPHVPIPVKVSLIKTNCIRRTIEAMIRIAVALSGSLYLTGHRSKLIREESTSLE